ncbi:copper resistance protein NlpE [Algoriphagus kandeliae]|uniref:Copper resistance protein NlpE n=1 Tax=Algoriphagus kandeliae TaxID=2562278 RepID=A0A4Y9QUQ9_9BACT|nr:copper resistance protein NlpE [Algoriphagus kandeliae]TFV95830.1 copper resistance protein NlpE [Algoriphagus kandeliae]
MKKSTILSAFLLLALYSCQKQESKTVEITEEVTKTVTDEFPETIEMPVPKGDNSMNALDWNGTYIGTIPCADCEGIEIELTLNLDGKYKYKATYLGEEEKVFEIEAPFQWDETGSMITLLEMEDAPGKYQVGENQLWHLDMNGKRIEGDLADRYILRKQ